MGSLSGSELERLLSRARTGDNKVQGRLLDHYRAYLGLIARLQIGRRLEGRFDASDVVQETFLKAWEQFDQFRGSTERELVAWLRQILANSLVDHVRRHHGQRRDVRLERVRSDLDQSAMILAGNLISASSSPSQQASRREASVLLADALAELPEHYREVLVLRHLEQTSFEEIARRMDRTIDSVKNVWTRALLDLRQRLEGPS